MIKSDKRCICTVERGYCNNEVAGKCMVERNAYLAHAIMKDGERICFMCTPEDRKEKGIQYATDKDLAEYWEHRAEKLSEALIEFVKTHCPDNWKERVMCIFGKLEKGAEENDGQEEN